MEPRREHWLGNEGGSSLNWWVCGGLDLAERPLDIAIIIIQGGGSPVSSQEGWCDPSTPE